MTPWCPSDPATALLGPAGPLALCLHLTWPLFPCPSPTEPCSELGEPLPACTTGYKPGPPGQPEGHRTAVHQPHGGHAAAGAREPPPLAGPGGRLEGSQEAGPGADFQVRGCPLCSSSPARLGGRPGKPATPALPFSWDSRMLPFFGG